jgi:hypothetical protein
MAYIHGFTTADNIVKDLVTQMCTGDKLVNTNNWTLVNPDPTTATGADAAAKLANALASITTKATVKASPTIKKQWVKKAPFIVTNGKITLSDSIAAGGGTRVYVRDKKYFLYLQKDSTVASLDLMEYKVNTATEIEVNVALNGKQVLVDYEKVVDITTEYYVSFDKPATVAAGVTNHYFFNWTMGTNYNGTTDTYPADHESMSGKCNWFKEGTAAQAIAHGWLPIEYWLSFDNNACTGVVMGDPGLSVSEWLSSPFYFGQLKQIEGALETDLTGNFAGFAGSYTEPTLAKTYGDYTGTGVTDVILAASKSGRPFQAHKVGTFGFDEFREKTFNGQSSHTDKHAVSDIVLSDVHENDRGILNHCLAVPRVAKEHGTELIYNRYISGEEETYIFLNINAPYTPFNTSSDVLLGFAIRTDI